MRLINKALLATVITVLSLVMCASPQDSRPRFEVASIKPNTSGRTGVASRFHLKLRREARQQPIYELSLAKSSSKMRLSADQNEVSGPEPPRGESPPHGRMRVNLLRGDLEANAVPIAQLVMFLSDARVLGRAVIDKTGLSGLYDFGLKWTADVPPGLLPPGVQLPPPDPSAASLPKQRRTMQRRPLKNNFA